jgi:hypothetical protein
MMHLFWTSVISPLLDAADARVVTEIGVDHGDTTGCLLERAAKVEGGVVLAIDPAPASEINASWEDAQRGRLRFHRARSHDALPRIGPVDAVLVDGDHNWFTVIGELRLLAAAAKAHDMPLPLLMAHDVGWPYGRRDMYYEPAAIPEDSRHDPMRMGMIPGRSELSPDGMNPWLWNAAYEGGPRNGVLTALEDFVAEYEVDCELMVVEGFHGLGIVASLERLNLSPALQPALRRLRSPEFAREWSLTLERARVDAYLSEWRALGKPQPDDADVERWGGPPHG